MSTSADGRGRRSQAERTAETVDLIINATLDAIALVGLRNATTGEISRRGGVSIGALFHHFESRLDIIVAAVEHNLEQRFAWILAAVDALRSDRSGPGALFRTLRSIAREPRSIVWLEVLMEARTDPELRARVTPILVKQRDRFRAGAALEPRLQRMSRHDRLTLIELFRNVLNGDAIWEPVVSHEDLDDPKLDALLALAADLSATETPSRGTPA